VWIPCRNTGLRRHIVIHNWPWLRVRVRVRVISSRLASLASITVSTTLARLASVVIIWFRSRFRSIWINRLG
jgi:hypothetical protein